MNRRDSQWVRLAGGKISITTDYNIWPNDTTPVTYIFEEQTLLLRLD